MEGFVGQGKRLFIVALVLFVCCVTSVFGQAGLRDRERAFSASQQIAADLRKAHFHHGAFYLLNTIQLSDIGYDSSFYVPTADRQSGFRFGIQAPTRLYIVPSKKTIYSIDVRPEWSIFSRGSKQNVFGYTARADAQYLLNHLYLDLLRDKGRPAARRRLRDRPAAHGEGNRCRALGRAEVLEPDQRDVQRSDKQEQPSSDRDPAGPARATARPEPARLSRRDQPQDVPTDLDLYYW